jgi:hypothetical protein
VVRRVHVVYLVNAIMKKEKSYLHLAQCVGRYGRIEVFIGIL